MIEWANIFLTDEEIAKKELNSIERIKNTYDVLDIKERERLSLQKTLTAPLDYEVLTEVFKDKHKQAVLDIGCNDGGLLINRLSVAKADVKYVLGVDVDPDIVVKASGRVKNPIVEFKALDCEALTFYDDIKALLFNRGLAGFDVITVSMVLLHLKDTLRLLRALYKLLLPNGTLFIRDMDDGLSIAYPDEENIVAKMLEISHKVPYTGYRHSGREIYSNLQKVGFTDIKIHPEEISTVGMDTAMREVLFRTNFQYIGGDLVLATHDDTNKYMPDSIWYNAAMPKLEQMFYNPEFYYRMGTMVFTAVK